MSYKVFLVEDEIVTREGIRDNVDWGAAGFEFCGEAPDGEMALPLIEDIKPDVLITDIKMPFMDGLQLSRIIHEHMPWIKILILSGHNEFEYAQSAVKLGISDYLLKPVSAQDINKVLVELAKTLDQEKQEREDLLILHNKVQDNLVYSREKFLFKLVMGGVSSAEVLEQSQQLDLEILARYYLILLVRIELCKNSPPFDYPEYLRVERIISELAGNNPDAFVTRKDMEEMVLLIKGDSPEQLLREADFLAGMIKNEVEIRSTCKAVIGMGSYQERLSDIHHSFAEALVKSKFGESEANVSKANNDQINVISMNQNAMDNYMKFGSLDEFDSFFADYLLPVAKIAEQSNLVKHYLFVDLILSSTQFISDTGGGVESLSSEVHEIEKLLREVNSLEQIKSELWRILSIVHSSRDDQASAKHRLPLQEAKDFLDTHFADPDITMRLIAEKFNISPSHFSTTFHREFGITFRDYLSQKRLDHAKQLLRTTDLSCSEIAYQSGFNDSHYFSFVFKKKVGISPRKFRSAGTV